MIVVHVRASSAFAGAERQMLGLARSLRRDLEQVFVLFPEGGRERAFQTQVAQLDFPAIVLPAERSFSLAAKLKEQLLALKADLVCCHGYKADLLGWWASRRAGVPVVAVAHGWTGQDRKVRFYEKLDRICMRWLDRVICVSTAEQGKAVAAGVAPERAVVIHNAIAPEDFARPDPHYREVLRTLVGGAPGPIICAAGRLSPEKGFAVLVEAAQGVLARDPAPRFVLFGDGPLRETLSQQIATSGLEGRFILAGFRNDLDRFLPFADLVVLPSYTEGLPCVVLEAFAAARPVVATAVGGTPEVIEDGVSGYLVPAGDAALLAARIQDVLRDSARAKTMGERGRERILDAFSFAVQGPKYLRLFQDLASTPPGRNGRHTLPCERNPVNA
jgi:glycosyltransferase involved in cell wall biosynthesis